MPAWFSQLTTFVGLYCSKTDCIATHDNICNHHLPQDYMCAAVLHPQSHPARMWPGASACRPLNTACLALTARLDLDSLHGRWLAQPPPARGQRQTL